MCWKRSLFECSVAPPSSAFLWVRWRSAEKNAAPAQSGTATEPHASHHTTAAGKPSWSWLMTTVLWLGWSGPLYFPSHCLDWHLTVVREHDSSGMTQELWLCWVAVITTLFLSSEEEISCPFAVQPFRKFYWNVLISLQHRTSNKQLSDQHIFCRIYFKSIKYEYSLSNICTVLIIFK